MTAKTGADMHSPRMSLLLLLTALGLKEGKTPFSDSFLGDNEVTANECMDLSFTLGNIIRGYLGADSAIGLGVLVAAFHEGSEGEGARLTRYATFRHIKTTRLKV